LVPNKGDEDCAALRAFELGASEGVELGEVLGFHRWLARAPLPRPAMVWHAYDPTPSERRRDEAGRASVQQLPE